jgi:chromosome partitioning protein
MVISITNLKGGVGKTTVSVNIATALAHRGYKVCIVDTDLQQTSSVRWSGQRDDDAKRVPVFAVGEKLNKEVEALNRDYQVVVIDGTPQLSELASRTILASDIVIVPISPSGYDFWAFEQFMQHYRRVKTLKEDLEAFILLNRYNENTNIGREVRKALSEFDVPIMKNYLAERVAYQETSIQGSSVIEYKDKKAKMEILALTDEVESLIKKYL